MVILQGITELVSMVYSTCLSLVYIASCDEQANVMIAFKCPGNQNSKSNFHTNNIAENHRKEQLLNNYQVLRNNQKLLNRCHTTKSTRILQSEGHFMASFDQHSMFILPETIDGCLYIYKKNNRRGRGSQWLMFLQVKQQQTPSSCSRIRSLFSDQISKQTYGKLCLKRG